MQSLAGNLTLKGSTVQMKMVINTQFIAPSRCTTGELWFSSPSNLLIKICRGDIRFCHSKMKMMSRSQYWTLVLYLLDAGTPMRELLYSPLVALFDSMSTRKQGQWTWKNESIKELNKLKQCLCGLEA